MRDDERRQKQAASTYKSLYDAPLFDGSYERRHLRILNSLFLATARTNGKPSLVRDECSVSTSFFNQHKRIECMHPVKDASDTVVVGIRGSGGAGR